MKKNKLLQLSLASFAALAISPIGGIATAQEDHHHHHRRDNWACYELELENENDVELESTITQDATSGDVVADGNTTVGDVGSGNTSNTQTNEVNIEIDNSSLIDNLPDPVAPTSNDDHHHHGGYRMEMDIENENDIEISNTIVQTANSGTVTVTDNTTVGDVTSGSATNTSTSTISISVM